MDRNLTVCGYGVDRDEVLIAYLYDDIEPAERASFEAHMATCDRCRTEVADLAGIRRRLVSWVPPEIQSSIDRRQPSITSRRQPSLVATGDGRPASDGGRQPAGAWWRQIPGWAQVAAAVLCLGVAAGVANLDVRFGHDGLSVRTGWWKAPAVAAVPVAEPSPWRADLVVLENQLRSELHAAEASRVARPAASPSSDADVLLRRVRGLLDESERRQQRELALRLAEVLRDVNAQRTADLVRIDRSLGIVQNNTGVEVAKQRELLNYLVRVSSQR